jgi:hypothetical protein
VLVQEWQVLGVGRLELPVDFLVQAYIDRYATTRILLMYDLG